jgi:hypothetical protein
MDGSFCGLACVAKKKILMLSQHTALYTGFKNSRRKNEKILDDATKNVNFIKRRPVHSRMFKNCVNT